MTAYGGSVFVNEDEDFLYLMLWTRLMDSNHASILSWSYKFRLFLRPLHVLCQVEFSKMRATCWPAILEICDTKQNPQTRIL